MIHGSGRKDVIILWTIKYDKCTLLEQWENNYFEIYILLPVEKYWSFK